MQKPYVPFVILLLVTIIVYGGVLTYPFLPWDDQYMFFWNEKLVAGDWLYFWKNQYHAIYMPVTYTVWGAMYKMFGFSPPVFHGAVVLCHLLNAYLIYLIINNFLKCKVSSLVGALIFLIHPIQVEVVAWAQGFRDSLAFLFTLSAIYVWISSVKWPFKLVAVVFAAVAILTKPTALVVVGVLGVYEILNYFLKVEKNPFKVFIKNIAYLLLLVPFVYLVFTVNTQVQSNIVNVVGHFGMLDRLVLVFNNAFFYLKQIVFPTQFYMNYGRTPAVVLAEPNQFFGILTVAAILCSYIYVLIKNNKETVLSLLFFGLWILIFFTPTSGVIPFEFQGHSAVADRYCYGVMGGVAFFIAYGYKKLQFWQRPQLRKILLMALLGVLGFTNLVQSLNWSTREFFVKTYYEGNPNNANANIWLAEYLVETGKDSEAEELYNKALSFNTGKHEPVVGLFTIYYNTKNYEKIDNFFQIYNEQKLITEFDTPPRVMFFIYYYASETYADRKNLPMTIELFCVAKKYSIESESSKLLELTTKIENQLNTKVMCKK